jgi:hypothetical protein
MGLVLGGRRGVLPVEIIKILIRVWHDNRLGCFSGHGEEELRYARYLLQFM